MGDAQEGGGARPRHSNVGAVPAAGVRPADLRTVFEHCQTESRVDPRARLTAWLAAKVQAKLKLVGVESIHLASVREALLRQASIGSSQPLGAKSEAAPAEWRAGDATG